MRPLAPIGVGLAVALVFALVSAGCSKADQSSTTASGAQSMATNGSTTPGAAQVKPVAVALLPGGGAETKSVDLKAGDTLVVILASNASTGYAWNLTAKPDASVLVSAGKQVQPPTTPMPGAPGHQVFSFSATAPGVARLTLSYARPFGNEKPVQVETFNVTVT